MTQLLANANDIFDTHAVCIKSILEDKCKMPVDEVDWTGEVNLQTNVWKFRFWDFENNMRFGTFDVNTYSVALELDTWIRDDDNDTYYKRVEIS